MEVVIRKPRLATVTAGILAFLLFAGRWGVNVVDHKLSMTQFFNILFEVSFQLRWWALAAMGIVVAASFCSGKKNQSVPLSTMPLVVLLLLFGVMIGGAGFTVGSDETWTKAIDVAGLALTALMIYYVSGRRSGNLLVFQESLLRSCFILGSALSLLAVATSDFTQRAAVGDGGPNTFVRIVGVAAVSCIGLRSIPKSLAFLATAGYLALIILTQSRGGLLSFLVAVGVQFLWIFGWKSKIVYGVLGISAVGIVAMFSDVGQRCIAIIEQRVFTQTFTYGYTAGRDRIYGDAWDIWMDNMLLGNGLNSWWDQLGTYPHNIFLEIGCDSGILGVGLFCIWLGFAIFSGLMSKTQTSKTIACVTLFYFMAAQFSGDIYDSRGLFYFGTLLTATEVTAMARRKSTSPGYVRKPQAIALGSRGK